MRSCPKCGRTYDNDKQKFCTIDGTPLTSTGALETGETIRIDAAQSAELDAEITKVISRNELGGFDPYKTTLSESGETTAPAPPAASTAAPPPPPTSEPVAPAPPPAPPAAPQTPSAPLPSAPPAEPVTSASAPPPGQTPTPPAIPPAGIPPPPPVPGTVPPPVPPRKKGSKLPLILGILAVLFFFGVIGIAAVYWFVARPLLAKRASIINMRAPEETPTPEMRATPDIDKPSPKEVVEAPPYTPPADVPAEQFVNSKANLDGKLLEHYVDFSFYYPQDWVKDPKAGVPGASNFAKVERRLPPDFTEENFAVGWYSSAGSEEGDRAVFHSLAENLSAQFAKGFTDYRKVSEGATRVSVYNGYEFRFESVSRNTDKGDIKIWGRVIFLPPIDGGQNGVTLLMLATSLAPELSSVRDVGIKGQLPIMLESFRFGK